MIVMGVFMAAVVVGAVLAAIAGFYGLREGLTRRRIG